MAPTLLREIQALEKTAEQVAGTSNLRAVLEAVVAGVVTWSGADRVTLIQFDWEARQVQTFLRAGLGQADVQTVTFDELLEGLSGWALRTGQVVLSSGQEPDPRESPEVQARRRATRCGPILVAPVGPGSGPLGTITLIRRPEDPDFTQEDADGLVLFAQVTGWLVRLAQERDRTSQAAAAAASANRSKTSFLSNLSHELRTPLNGILGFSHLLDASTLTPYQHEMVQTILQSGQRLLGTVDNLLELAHLEAGQFHLELAPFSPRAVLESVVAKHRDAAAAKGLVWSITSDPGLPAVLEGDAVRIGHAWSHIVSNAVKFTSQGTITIHLETKKTARSRSKLILHVADTGVGLSDGSGQWFVPFHQEDGSLTRKFGGTGLGLALCDRIVRRMGGGLSLWGEPGVGTKVRVWVDLGPPAALGFPTGGLRVLVQDPDAIGSLTLVRLLEKAGHRVDYVATLGQAAERLRSGSYEVLLTESPSPDPRLVASLVTEEHPIHLIGVGGASEGATDVLWSGILERPVTHDSLQAVLQTCGPGGAG